MSEEISKSKAKREQRKADAEAMKRKQGFESVIGWIVGIAIALVVIVVIVLGIYQSADKTVSDNNYSTGLNKDGRIKGAKLSTVKDIGLDGLTIDYSEIEYTDEEVQKVVDQHLDSLAEYSTDPSLTVKDGDSINLDYVGYVNDVAFDGGNTNGNGTTLVIGSGRYVDNFEEQLIGSHPGDSLTVNVTFPEDYGNEELNGKPARFECVINSVRVVPELTDELVKEKLSDYGSTVDEYKAFLKTLGEKSNIQAVISSKIADNASAKAPGAYVKHLRQLLKYTDEQSYSYINNMYMNYYGQVAYKTFEEYTGKNETDYEKSLKDSAKRQAAIDMTYENYFVQHGLTISDEAYNLVLESSGGDSAVSTYGEAFLRQNALKQVVIDHLTDNVTINR